MINDYEATTPITTDAHIGSEDVKDSTISTLNGLIAIGKDGEDEFKKAAEKMTDLTLKDWEKWREADQKDSGG